jgi:hypothetical protein
MDLESGGRFPKATACAAARVDTSSLGGYTWGLGGKTSGLVLRT